MASSLTTEPAGRVRLVRQARRPTAATRKLRLLASCLKRAIIAERDGGRFCTRATKKVTVSDSRLVPDGRKDGADGQDHEELGV